MAENFTNIRLPVSEWVDLYALSGVSVGVALSVENIGSPDVYLTVSATKPSPDHDAYNVLRREDEPIRNSSGDPGAWAFCQSSGGMVSVSEVGQQGFRKTLQEQLGFGIPLDAWGTQRVSIDKSIFHGMFTFDIPPSMWLKYENGSEVAQSTAITSVNGAAKLLTTATETELLLESRETPRYQPDRGHKFSTAGWLPNKTADGVRDFGLFTAEDGVFFRLKSDGLLYAVLKSGSVETHEEQIDTSVLSSFDVEKNNIYDIQFQWRSAGNYKFFIGDPQIGGSKLVHEFRLLGTLTSASIENPATPIAFKATRTTENVEINMGCADITSENGKRDDTERYASAYAEAVTVPSAIDQPVIIVRQPMQINSKTNTRTISLARISVTCDKKAVFKVWISRNPADITGATFRSVNSGSFVETDSTDMDATAVRATSVNTANMLFVTSVPVEALVRIGVDNPYRDRIEFPLVRGDYLVVTCRASQGSADVTIEWGEQI